MTIPLVIIGLAVLAALIQAIGAVLRKQPTMAAWFFCAGMLVFAVEALLLGLLVFVQDPAERLTWLRRAMVAKAFIPGFWLAFSLTYSRGNGEEFLQRWWLVLLVVFVMPFGLVAGGYENLAAWTISSGEEAVPFLLLGPAVKLLNGILLLASVLIIINLEKTIRSAVGTERWRVKFVFLGVGLIFGTRIYSGSMVLLYPGFDPALISVEKAAFLIGCILIAVAYYRRGFREVEIYPSLSVLQGSVTLILAGIYLVAVGLFAQGVSRFGWENFPVQAFIILIGLAGLAGLLLSDRFRTSLQRWVARNFKRPEHDFRKVWSSFSQRTSGVMDGPELCRASAELVSETFDVLNVVAFLQEQDAGHFAKAASTSQAGEIEQVTSDRLILGESSINALREKEGFFDLDQEDGGWAEPLKEILPNQFSSGGHRFVLPLVTEKRLLGVIILADRVNGIPYSQEERELLACIGDQLAAALLNRTLIEQVVQAKELEAFQTMSTFFVHDLKNAANSLTLMLENLPRHFDDPEFRKDALRMIGKTADRINGMIRRLSSLRQKLEIVPVETDMNALIERVLEVFDKEGGKVERKLRSLPMVQVDPEQIESVVTNLLVNAREASGSDGVISIETEARGGEVVLTVRDDGCGMSTEFVEGSLFKPFNTTKSKGLGIGMFQSKMIVDAHQGRIRVESAPGEGASFHVILPLGR